MKDSNLRNHLLYGDTKDQGTLITPYDKDWF